MSRTPANLTQADIARTIRAAKQCGAPAVVVKYPDGTTVTVRLDEPVDGSDKPLAAQREIVL